MDLIDISSRGSTPSIRGLEWNDEERPGNDEQAGIERRFKEMPARAGHFLIDLTQESDKTEEEEEKIEDTPDSEIGRNIEVIDLTATRPRARPRLPPPKRNPSISLPNVKLKTYMHNDVELKEGVTVEIEPVHRLYNASFLFILLIIRTEFGILLRGLPLTRTRYLRGQLPRFRNEVAQVLEIDQDDPRPDEEQAAIEVPVDMVKMPRDCVFTNKDFPEHRFEVGIYANNTEIEERAVLVCRWKFRRIWTDAVKRTNGKPPVEFGISRLTAEQVIKDRYRASSASLINAWRGGKIRGGSFIPDEPDGSKLTVDIDAPEVEDNASQDQEIPIKPGQQYSFADMFCGAGGASSGVRAAGFRVVLSCDNAEGACNTYRMEFPETDLRQQHMFDFFTLMREARYHVDVLHLSPPCQYWSPAHTTPGVNDEANIAILFSCHELVKCLRPRIFTLEQTYGILLPRFEFYFNALIHGFTQHGFSIRWKVVNLLTWGAPSQRQRLIMIGSCPGEELPNFPTATHSESPSPSDGTKPYRTVKQMLRKMNRNVIDDLHDPRKLKRQYHESWDPNVPLARTITCTGGVGNYHYSGRRQFTVREYAMLQGFPPGYRFQPPDIKKQVGNAFPPPVVKTLYTHLRRWLEEKDRVLRVEGDVPGPEEDDQTDWGSGSDPDAGMESDNDEDDVVYMGGRELIRAISEVEFLGGRKLHQQASSVTIDDSESGDCMDVDAMSTDVRSQGFCIDAIQPRGTSLSCPIELD
ncbi:S-adenosyl-L-methionine-dependent methyltransferase [Hypoxylon sp. NC1633]|nr:S-adenosyl-L-methionine-dependent methyltransferase [Hypoxylon sp. NC1633]